MVAKTPHNSGNNFTSKLGSLSKANVPTLDLMTMQFVSVINKSIHIKKILRTEVGSITKKMK
jgi:hypothetical protein